MLAAATSFFARTAISQSYTTGSVSQGSRTATPAPSGSLPVVSHAALFHVGPWKIQPAVHKTTYKRVSIWTYDKRSQEAERLNPSAKDRVVEVLKAEASALGRLRHPCILEMVEPLEETRSELVFATEPLLSSLHYAIPDSAHSLGLVELDEVEIQKGILQLCKGLSFLHTSARLIHSNINPESVLINASGDWKIAGLGLTISLTAPDGGSTRWEYPAYDGRAPLYTQRSFDYIAPEYALDESLITASDMYSLGCLLYAVHCKGNPPFRNRDNLGRLRENAGKSLTGIDHLDRDLRALLNSLITRNPTGRPTPTTIPTQPFFSSLPISTLNFLDRSTFASKSREEKVSFMKGLTGVLDKFSEGLRTRKILPSLVEEMKDTHLLPYILPNVFLISSSLSPSQFASLVLPSLTPLFAIKEPPQNMLTLLENLQLLQGKTDKRVFREHVLPLVYNALESEHAVVQERALGAVPDLCETIDYAEVQGVIFPRVALVFTQTRILSVKVATLVTFLSMVKTLDQASLTQKLVPLLSKIRTKEPAVMLATLTVQEAMGLKVDREAVATLILPQLWTMSMGPLLNLDQFKRFMDVIRKLGDRVEREHTQHLRDSQRIEDRSATAASGTASGITGGSLDFESLVAGASGATVKADTVFDHNKGWDGDDVWGSILTAGAESPRVRSPLATGISSLQSPQSLPSSPKPATTSTGHSSRPSLAPSVKALGAKHISSNSFSSGNFAPPRQFSTISGLVSSPATTLPNPVQPNFTDVISPIAIGQSLSQIQKPNYNIQLPPAPNMSTIISTSSMSSPPQIGMGSLLAPSAPSVPSRMGTQTKKLTSSDWGDFDPLA